MMECYVGTNKILRPTRGNSGESSSCVATLEGLFYEFDMNNLKYVQLEAGAFIGDIDFQVMTTRQRGVYISLILYLYANEGKLTVSAEALSKLCNSTLTDFYEDWEVISHKFQEDEYGFTHKRVSHELDKAQEYYEKKRSSGQKGGFAKASNATSTAKATPLAKVSKGKGREEKNTNNGFEEFWEAYPKKKSKGDALKWWKKNKPSQELQLKIHSTLYSLKGSPEWLKDGGQYAPYPATWLNADGWNDEIKTNKPVERKCQFCGEPSTVYGDGKGPRCSKAECRIKWDLL